MIKILFQVQENKLFCSIRKRLNSDQKNLMNTNIISQNELVFSDDYIIENKKLIHNFLKELIIDTHVNTIIIKELNITPLILQIITNITQLTSLYILEENILNYKICESIIKTNTIKYVSVYNIPTYLLELLDQKKIIVDSRNEMLFISHFMSTNNLNKFSSLYYKTSINLEFPFTEEDQNDFESFININKYLKKIYVNKVNKNDIENILEVLYKNKIKNIKIYIKDNITDPDIIAYLKKINKKNKPINGIQFKLDYSQEYLQNNFLNQLNLNTIKTCIYISLGFISLVVFFVFYSNYISMQNVESIQEDIYNTMAKYEENQIEQEEQVEKENDEGINNEPIIEEENIENQIEETPKTYNNKLVSLLDINEDTVGWLKVNNTNVDYPVVQYTDNEFYLTKNFKKENDNAGWLFMDYRADSINLSQNTIIFGHNMYYSGVMFGTLYKANQSNWYKNEENQIIEFNTLYENLKWKIFSIYKIPSTNDYLIADFNDEEQFSNFLNLIVERSIYNFDVPVSPTDKILTLSTCASNGTKRLVIHAVLVK